jgi:hypothetical protein
MPYRDAQTGEYVDEEYAQAHPDTTVHEDDDTPDEDDTDYESITDVTFEGIEHHYDDGEAVSG